ncbi:TetR family transcriptional regulator [Streptomyces antimycoticus]|uniref:TetR family transcriptional regulator n=3 Tax=Streptomyces TaxID=1883 RepID=A0ABD5JLJ6_9ACTN|nr:MULTISPECIES: TetR family transcriptional regulator [Streptomyces]MEE4588769.1 TetR family transcriptional regulator [Streptomyces sp. DSM 41602]AJZ82179.2 TetR family transcriptional regulator [Streptomyces sp. AgN23]KUL51293.1 TetR family transcriptional regulator [Streptomyces violaceusniger]RSS36551.1 TetR/AcrR family transcriptional regulator [Streptomyces sp. WAC05858]WJD98067.1 TetR family transcriptional regulator [Streptomyces antimycoticus]
MTPASSGPATGPRKRGRPARTSASDGPGARDRILAAARNEFAERGYDKTSIRGIAKAAEVDPALVHHYFGTKEQVFEAAIELIFAPAMAAPDAVHGSREGAGERMARFMFGIWENPVSRLPLLAVMRSALTNEAAAAVLRGMIERRVLLRMAGELDVPNPEFRAQLAAGHLIGIAMLRYVIRMEPMASAEVDDIVAMVGPTLRRYLTES